MDKTEMARIIEAKEFGRECLNRDLIRNRAIKYLNLDS